MKFGSLFSGIGGFELGLERAGMECAWQCEIDPHCRRLLAAKFPHASLTEDVTHATGLEPVDLICGGFPCQDLSVAGRRAGLAGERSGLWHQFHRILDDLRPRWVVVENVPGLLSSNGGADFAVILRGLVELGYCVSWRILDAKYFGLAQRRRRVFIVGSLGGGSCAQVLFESESVSRNHPARSAAGEGTAPTLASRTRGGGGLGTDAECDGALIASTIRSADGHHGHSSPRGDGGDNLIAGTIQHNYADKWGLDNQHVDAGCPNFVVGAAGWDPRNVTSKANRTRLVDGVTPTLHEDGMAVAFTISPSRGTGDGHGNAWNSNYVADPIQANEARTQSNAGNNPRPRNVVADTIRSHPRPGSNSLGNMVGVRRLTPRECERLQGFPDDWTAGFSDSTRYKMLGNAVAVPCAEWIGRRILAL